MRKSLLTMYMQKVAEGDRSYVDRLCKQLSDRLVFAPVVSAPAAAPGSKSKSTFSVLRMNEASRSLVPIFTSEKRFKEWGEKRKHGGGSISLLGGDFCAALGTDTWVIIDPGFDDSLELEPSLVLKVSESGLSEEPIAAEEDSIEIEVPQSQVARPAPVAAPPPKGLVKNAMFSSQPSADEYVSSRDRIDAASHGMAPKPAAEQEDESTPALGSKLIRSALFTAAGGGSGSYQADKAKEKAGLSSSPLHGDQKRSSLASATMSAADATGPSKPERQTESEPEGQSEPKKKKSFLSFLKGN